MKPENLIDESACEIDENQLGKECKRQPSLYLQAAVMAADARRDADEMKAEMEVYEAELAQRVRSKPDKYNLEKITEGAIDAVVASHPKMQEKAKAYRDLKHKETIANALVAALDHKKRSLTLLVNLHGTSYFADVKPSQEGRAAVRGESWTKHAKAVKRHRDKEVQKEDNDE